MLLSFAVHRLLARVSRFYGLGLQDGYAGTTQAASAEPSLAERVAALELDAAATRNRAFVFVKPHAVNDKVTEFVKEKLGEAGVAVTDTGMLDAKTIDEKRLIDNHYGAIASKAMSVKPKDLNVPAKGQEKFKELFGMSWDAAVKSNKVSAYPLLPFDGHVYVSESHRAGDDAERHTPSPPLAEASCAAVVRASVLSPDAHARSGGCRCTTQPKPARNSASTASSSMPSGARSTARPV